MKTPSRYFKLYDERNRLILVSCVKENILFEINKNTDIDIKLEDFMLPSTTDRFYKGMRVAVAERLNKELNCLSF